MDTFLPTQPCKSVAAVVAVFSLICFVHSDAVLAQNAVHCVGSSSVSDLRDSELPDETASKPYLVVNNRWEGFLAVELLSRDFALAPAVGREGVRAIGAHGAGVHILIASAIFAGADDLRTLLDTLRDQLWNGTTFLEPGAEGRPTPEIAGAMLDRWRSRLDAGRLSVIDLYRISNWLRTFYESPGHLSEEAQMRLWLALVARPSRRVDRVPADGREMWSLVREQLNPLEFVVSGVDRDADGQVDQWILLGKDRRGEIFLFAPWSRSRKPQELPAAVLSLEAHASVIVDVLRTRVVFDQRDPENPAQLIGRRIYRAGGAK